MTTTALSPIQLQLFHLFSYQKKEEELEEMRDVLLSHIRAKCDEESRRIWGEISRKNILKTKRISNVVPVRPRRCIIVVSFVKKLNNGTIF